MLVFIRTCMSKGAETLTDETGMVRLELVEDAGSVQK